MAYILYLYGWKSTTN